jgi:hypothetical protein
MWLQQSSAMTDDPFYAPGRNPRHPRPGEVLFEFVRESDRAQFRCELRTREPSGFEVQFFMAGELFIAQKFERRDLALEWAELERRAIENVWTA